MVNLHTCPRCRQMVAEIRRHQSPAVCDSCGFVLSSSEKHQASSFERSIILSAIGFGVAVLGLLYHVGTWGGHSLEIIPLKVGQIARLSSAQDMERLVEIGMDIRDYDMVEKTYRMMAERIDAKNYLRLAKFQFSRAEFGLSVNSYRLFFAVVKNSVSADVRYDYARALAEAGQIDEAAKNFDYVLSAKPGVRQVTVIQKYVAALVRSQRYDQAQRVIERVRRLDPSATNFMDTEYKVITARRKNHT